MIIRTLHKCELRIDKRVPRIIVWSHESCLVMPNADPWDRFAYLYLTQMIDSFSCISLDDNAQFKL